MKSNLNYDQVVRYWNGMGKKPGESNAYSGLMELVSSLKCENNIVHYDVIDAMIRQPFSAETKPFKLHLIGKSSVVNAVDYDLGRNGAAYFDKDTADYHVATGKGGRGNRGRIYRNDGVDIRKDSSSYESYYVSDIEDGEWLQYTIKTEKAGTYSVSLNIAAPADTSRLTLEVNGKQVAKDLAVPATGSLKSWKYVELKNIRLIRGSNKVRVYADKGGFNLKDISFNTRP